MRSSYLEDEKRKRDEGDFSCHYPCSCSRASAWAWPPPWKSSSPCSWWSASLPWRTSVATGDWDLLRWLSVSQCWWDIFSGWDFQEPRIYDLVSARQLRRWCFSPHLDLLHWSRDEPSEVLRSSCAGPEFCQSLGKNTVYRKSHRLVCGGFLACCLWTTFSVVTKLLAELKRFLTCLMETVNRKNSVKCAFGHSQLANYTQKVLFEKSVQIAWFQSHANTLFDDFVSPPWKQRHFKKTRDLTSEKWFCPFSDRCCIKHEPIHSQTLTKAHWKAALWEHDQNVTKSNTNLVSKSQFHKELFRLAIMRGLPKISKSHAWESNPKGLYFYRPFANTADLTKHFTEHLTSNNNNTKPHII